MSRNDHQRLADILAATAAIADHTELIPRDGKRENGGKAVAH